MIYAVEVLEGKFVKIGFSSSESTAARIAALQTGNPFEIVERMTVEGTLRQEQAIHASLRTAFTRIGIPIPPNEWYPGRCTFFVQFLEHLAVSANHAIAFAEKYNPNVKQHSATRGPREPSIKWPKAKGVDAAVWSQHKQGEKRRASL